MKVITSATTKRHQAVIGLARDVLVFSTVTSRSNISRDNETGAPILYLKVRRGGRGSLRIDTCSYHLDQAHEMLSALQGFTGRRTRFRLRGFHRVGLPRSFPKSRVNTPSSVSGYLYS